MMKRFRVCIAVLMLACLAPAASWGAALHCDIDTGGALPFSPFTKENPIAVDQDTPDYAVILSLDYAQFLPHMRLSCTSDGQEFAAPTGFDGDISLSLSAINDDSLNWDGEAQTANNGIKMKFYIKAVSYNQETLPSSYPPARLALGKQLDQEYPIMSGKDDTTLFQFGAQHNADKSLFKYDAVHNYAIESMRVELVKFGWMEYNTQQVIPAGAHLTFSIDGMSGITTVNVPLGSGVYIAAPSCVLDEKHQNVGLGSFSKRSDATYPLEGKLVRFGIGFTCSSYTNNVELTFTDANATLQGHNLLVANNKAGAKLEGVGVGIYDAEGKRIIMGIKQNLGAGRSGPNTANFQAAIVQTSADITDSRNASFTGDISAKANLVISYY